MIHSHFRFVRWSILPTLFLMLVFAGIVHAQSASGAAPAGDSAQPTPSPRPAGGAFTRFFRDATVFAIGDGYVTANTNRPPGDENLLRNFDTRSGRPQLSYVEAAFEKKATDRQRVGLRLDVGAGSTARMVGAPEPGPSELKYFQQAYVSVLAPVGSGLTIDVGKFVTPAGAEVIETQDNWNYSRGLLFAWAIPYYHAGIRAGYAASDRITVTGLVMNGWNDVKDKNQSPSLAAQIAVRPSDRVTVTGTWIGGEEQVDADGWRNLVDAIVSVTVSPRLKLLVNADLARDRGLGPGVGWHGVSTALRAQVSPRWTIAPRVEWFADPQGAATGVAQEVTDATFTVERTLVPGLVARGEYRVDRSTANFFPSNSAEMRRTQQTVGFGLLYGWSK